MNGPDDNIPTSDLHVKRLPLPPYTYVPGRAPHPISHPDGHRFAGVNLTNERLEVNDWRRCDAYRYGLQLFDAGYYWEAHEVWEGCWNAAGRRGPLADFLKALIKLAAALVKAREGRPTGVRRHAARCAELMAGVKCDGSLGATRVAGLQLADILQLASYLQDHAEPLVAEGALMSPHAVTPLSHVQLSIAVE